MLSVPPKAANVLVAATAFTAYGRIAVVTISLWIPGICVVVAGFQNIDDSDPPAATPAYDDPCP
jgi:hypothetical protein